MCGGFGELVAKMGDLKNKALKRSKGIRPEQDLQLKLYP